jgi:hypothetical protein
MKKRERGSPRTSQGPVPKVRNFGRKVPKVRRSNYLLSKMWVLDNFYIRSVSSKLFLHGMFLRIIWIINTHSLFSSSMHVLLCVWYCSPLMDALVSAQSGAQQPNGLSSSAEQAFPCRCRAWIMLYWLRKWMQGRTIRGKPIVAIWASITFWYMRWWWG